MKFDIAQGLFVEMSISPEHPAIDDGLKILSWREFESDVAKWVTRARTHGIARDIPLVIHGHKEVEFFVAMTGCLVIGAPFVPADTIYPKERLDRIIKISGAPYCYSTQTDHFTRTDNHESKALPEKNLAYIIFTSGSTGEPKGVQIGRESIVSLVTWMENHFELGSAPVFMNQAPFSFDLSMYEVMATLGMGGCCVMNDRQIASDSSRFLPRQRDAHITTWVSTPSFAYQQLINKQFNSEFLPTLHTFLFCGEPLPHALAKRLSDRFPECRIINTYGPTEATVATTSIVIDRDVLATYNPLPVGYSKPDCDLFVDPKTGELCIAGDHVMRGYLNRDDLNELMLFEHKGKRAFRTGDLGEIDDNGLIFCRGRIDEQVKFNGFRIELSDIDNALQRTKGISSAAVVALRRPDGAVGRLVGFVVLDAARDMADAELLTNYKEKLAELLPAYMIPSELVLTADLPLSINHKVDRKKLAELYMQKR